MSTDRHTLSLAHWTDQARRDRTEAARLTAALAHAPADHPRRRAAETEVRTLTERAAAAEERANAARRRVIGPRTGLRTYTMRGGNGIPSDIVTEWTRTLGGQRFDLCRVQWADGTTTVQAYPANTTIERHRITL